MVRLRHEYPMLLVHSLLLAAQESFTEIQTKSITCLGEAGRAMFAALHCRTLYALLELFWTGNSVHFEG